MVKVVFKSSFLFKVLPFKMPNKSRKFSLHYGISGPDSVFPGTEGPILSLFLYIYPI